MSVLRRDHEVMLCIRLIQRSRRVFRARALLLVNLLSAEDRKLRGYHCGMKFASLRVIGDTDY